MLYAINGGQVEGCDLRQQDIVHLETTVERATAGGQLFVFYDRNATLTYSMPFTDLAKLDEVAWDLLTEAPKLDGFCKYWKTDLSVERYVDRMARRQAEFLVQDRVALSCFIRIGVVDATRLAQVKAILGAGGVALPIEVKRDWYFLPGQ